MYFEMERIQALEYIVRHYTGLDRYGKQDLEMVIARLSPYKEGQADSIEGRGNFGSSESGSADTASTGK